MGEINCLVKKGCGVDIDSKLLWATAFTTSRKGQQTWETKSFENSVRGVLEFSTWLKEMGVTHVAFESTGIYWQILYSFLEDEFTVIVANPWQIKQLKGKKTDPNDSKRIAILLQMGVIEPSFVPPQDIRELRDLCRQYQNLTEDIVRLKNRIIKTLRQAGIILDTCMTDVFGKSGRAIIEALIDGEGVEEAAENARGKLRKKLPEIRNAVRYPITDHNRSVLFRYWRLLLAVEDEHQALDTEIEKNIKPYCETVDRLMTMTGVGRKVSRCLISEIGTDMASFSTAKNLCSWAKVCPGNNRSGGKRISGRNSKGNRYVRAYLGEAAWAAVRTKGSAFRQLYLRRAARLGKKKAIMSVMHKMLRMIHAMLSNSMDYMETYESIQGTDAHFDSVRSRVRNISNEDLVQELIARGAKNIEWSWEETAGAVAL